jgi:hypothetical protein
MRNFFYKYWVLYYIIFFLLIGLLIYALLWTPDLSRYTKTINDLNNQLEDCNNRQNIDSVTAVIDTTNTKIDNTINCDATVQSGGQGETNTQHELGKSSGTVVIEYDMKSLPDEINVYYDNVVVASSSGLVSGLNSIQFKYTAKTGKPTFCIVTISAPYDNTEWEYLLNCPQ